MIEPGTRQAIWEASWYALDQTLVVDELEQYQVWDEGPNQPLRFVCGLGRRESSARVNGRVVRIDHHALGSIHSVRNEGFDYFVKPLEGEEIQINSEEEPGAIWDESVEAWLPAPHLEPWRFDVVLEIHCVFPPPIVW